MLEDKCFRDKKIQLRRVKGIGRRPRERDVVVEWRPWCVSKDCTRKRVNHEGFPEGVPGRGDRSWCRGPNMGVPGSSDEV